MESIIFSSQRNEIPTPPKPSDGDGGVGKAASTGEGGVHGGDGEPLQNPTTDEKENQGMNPIIGANCAGSADLQENISNGPLYGDWITVSRNRKSNKHKQSHAGQKGEKGTGSTTNKFQILGSKASETCHSTIFSWSDGTKTSLPVARVLANHFRFRDEGEKGATSSIVFKSEQEINVVLPTPKEPPYDRCKEPHVDVSESHKNVHVPQSSLEVDGSC
ncbi:hypothetical protein SESBI_46642 [Sesbania bispinosa]|nr:hypothetical protein SESBI_46642 [Sesbania bispinosa]